MIFERFLSTAGVALFLGYGCADSHVHGPTPGDCSACAADELCIAGACMPGCDDDPPDLASDIAPDLVAVASLCGVLPAGPIAARAGEDGALTIVQARTEIAGDEVIVRVDRYQTSLETSALVPSAPTCTTTFRPSRPGMIIELSAGMGLSPSGALAHFGLNARNDDSADRHIEAMAYVVGEDCVFRERPLAKFGGSALLSEDPEALLVLGLVSVSAPGGGFALRRGDTVVARASVFGSVQRVGADHVLLPTLTGHGAVLLELFVASDLATGVPPARSIAQSDFETWPLDFVMVEGRGIVGRLRWGDEGHMLFPLTVEGDHIPAGERSMFASERIAQVVPIAGTSRVLLQHDAGLLVVE